MAKDSESTVNDLVMSKLLVRFQLAPPKGHVKAEFGPTRNRLNTIALQSKCQRPVEGPS